MVLAPDRRGDTDSYRTYHALNIGTFRPPHFNHMPHFAQSKNHIGRLENFWNQAKRALRKYNGINKDFFSLFLKGCEFRFDYETLKQQLKTLKLWCDI